MIFSRAYDFLIWDDRRFGRMAFSENVGAQNPHGYSMLPSGYD